ncbi:DNA ligase [Desulfospira joergensenii]|uniref:DNA ligase n=1 Tax=Desulfospira joergensenii TaxID=53329 RepID=UPI0003B34651|nr:DNA ligase [Desulfospira joergensenii]
MLVLFSCPFLYAREIFLQKAKSYTGKEEVIGWVMSEKLDGIRGYWNGRQLLTRKGLSLSPPSWFIQNFPPFELDGELWSKRGDFEFIQSVALDKEPGDGWKRITYNIFEVPNQKGRFLSRLKKAATWFKSHPNPHVRIIPQTTIKEEADLHRFFSEVESKGGEGIIIKDPEMVYHTGRSPHVLKVKRARDMEGVVIGINQGKGKYKSVMGSLTLKLKNGVIFKLGTGFTDRDRSNPPPVGTVVTFKYHGFSKNGIPRFASFLRMRLD